MSQRLFISHSSLDNAAAVDVRDWLRAEGWADIFLDLDAEQGIAPGQRWQDELRRAATECAAVVVLLSPNWVASRWCQSEFLVAEQLGKLIFPVFVAPTSFDDLPIELKAKFQIADISTPDGRADGFRRLGIGLKRAGLDPTAFEWPPSDDPARSVYPGLRALDIPDAAVFFGRDAEITRGLEELRQLRRGARERVMVVLGSSGSGKSSFLRAGLLARLARDTENFVVLPVVRPQRRVLTGPKGLAEAFSAALGEMVPLNGGSAQLVALFERLRDRSRLRLSGTKAEGGPSPTVVVPLDQAEELYSGDADERQRFVQTIVEALQADLNVILLVTIRSDAYNELQHDPVLGRVPQRPFSLTPLAAGAFKEVIEGPARLAKPPLKVEPALTQQLLYDLHEADALPLLAFTLERLWRLSSSSLSREDYVDRLGGLTGAIQSAVGEALGPHPSAETLAQARALYIPALVRITPDGVKRRVAKRSEFPDDLHALIERFVNQRLLVIDGDAVEIAHEAILRHWTALQAWVQEETDGLRLLDGVRSAALEWQRASDRAAAGSWLAHTGARLQDATEAAGRPAYTGAVDELMRRYLRACQRRAARQRAISSLPFATMVIAATIIVVFAGRLIPMSDDWAYALLKHAPWVGMHAMSAITAALVLGGVMVVVYAVARITVATWYRGA